MVNDIVRDNHCDVTMINKDVAMCTYHTITIHYGSAELLLWYITMPNCVIAVSPVNSLKYFIKINIILIVVWHKSKNKCMVIICEDHVNCFWYGYFTCHVDSWNIPTQIQLTLSQKVITHSLVLVIVFWMIPKCQIQPWLPEELLMVLGKLPLQDLIPTWSIRQGFGYVSVLVSWKPNTPSKFLTKTMICLLASWTNCQTCHKYPSNREHKQTRIPTCLTTL